MSLPTDNKEKLTEIQNEISLLKPTLSEATDVILDQDVTRYPIFVIHKDTIEIGIPLIDRNTQNSKWTVNVSSLEEFATKQLIQEDKVSDFKKVYKNPLTHLCLFILSDMGANFIFMPR
jgi:hypothetical protein